MKNDPKELIDDLKVLRTIHSNRARTYSVRNFYYLIITIIVAAIVTFFGFSNSIVIQKTVMDLITLSILIITILSLILKFEQKVNKHNSAVIRLTEFISLIEFSYLADDTYGPIFSPTDNALYAEKYKSIINSLPPTKDSDYIYALRTIKKKKKMKAFIESEEYDNKTFIARKWRLLWI